MGSINSNVEQLNNTTKELYGLSKSNKKGEVFENTIEGVIYDIINSKKSVIETVMGDNLNRADIVEEIMNKINSL